MFNYDVVIIGGGPAGLTAGLYLSRGKHRTILLEKESFGGYLTKLEWIENYPGFPDRVSGADLSSRMLTQATKYGLELKQTEVVRIRPFTSSRWVKCAGGGGYTAKVVIIAGGARPKQLGIPGEQELQGKGVIYCAFCEGSQFSDRVVAVCGGGNAGIIEASYLTKLASKVILFELEPALTADAIIQERTLANNRLQIRCGVKVEAILGSNRVEAVKFLDMKNKQRETLEVDGILVHVGLEPNTSYLKGIVKLDSQGKIIVNERMETDIPYILAAGEITSSSCGQIITAAGDGAKAAFTAENLLQELA